MDSLEILAWQRPTLPRGRPRSTIGEAVLNFSVRNGKRCTHRSTATKQTY